MEDHDDALAGLLLGAVADLRAGRYQPALDALAVLFADRDFAETTELDDVKARAASLYAQALLAADRPAEAWRWSDTALRLARTLDDAAGLAEIRGQQEAIRDALTRAAQRRAAAEHGQRLASRSVDEILAGLSDPATRADALVKKANAELDAGRADAAVAIAQRALEEATAGGSLSTEVFARIAIARSSPQEAVSQLTSAWQRAERANEFNLVGAVAKAAELLRVRLPTLVGPAGEA